tara:strand:+ start:57 stop:302 length:246 start_codon:yes stop_codon:yes gene_type:complete
MAFKMKNPFKQMYMPILTPRMSLGKIVPTENYSKEDKAASALSQKKRKCNESANTEWKNGKCVNKKIVIRKGAKSGSEDMA